MSRPTTTPEWSTDAAYPAGADPWSGTDTKVEPTSGVKATGAVPQVGFGAQQFNWLVDNLSNWINYLDARGLGVFGDGSDGDITADGSTAVAGATRSGSVYSLTRDVFWGTAVVSTGVQVKTEGFRIFCFSTLTVEGTGVITADGLPAVGATGGAASPGGTLMGGAAGGGGGSGGAGSAGSASTNSIGGAGGAGGQDASTAAGAAGGTVTAIAAADGSPRIWSSMGLGYVIGQSAGTAAIKVLRGGAGGGGGHGDGSAAGAGGGGAGVLAVAARRIVLAAASGLRARGGAGAAQSGGGGAAGGGGGGGGGGLILGYASKNTFTLSAATNCPGGAGGAAGTGASTAGATGSNGLVYELALG